MTDTDYVAETKRLLALAASLAEMGALEQSVAAYRIVAKRHPSALGGWRQLAIAATEQKMTATAVAAVKRALALSPGSADTIRLLPYVELGEDRAGQHRMLALAAFGDPHDARSLARLATSYQSIGRPGQAERIAREALSRDPSLVEARLNLAVLLRNSTRVDEARVELRRAAVLDPASAIVWRRIAITEEILSNLQAAETAARRALTLDANDHSSTIALAFVQRRTGRHEEALRALRALPEQVVGEIGRETVEFELGTLHDLQGEPEAAFAHFTAGNALAVRRAAIPSDDSAAYLDELRTHEAAVSAPQVARWTTLPDAEQPPVFMVGFPRSGTTLLDQVLDAHPGIRVLEERPVLSALASQFARPLATFPDRLAALTPEQATLWRERHAARLRRFAGPDAPAMVIDKMPLNVALTGLIVRLYPNAKIVLSLRHPCDCCLSCFMQPFRLNPAMANFVDLDATTRLYALVMGIWLRVRDTLGPDHVVVRYEDLIDDVEGHARRTVDFLGVDWHDRMLEHLDHARSRGLIRTPSFRQVTEPIYTRARGRWHRYRAHLEPYMDRLAPFIAEFGYDD